MTFNEYVNGVSSIKYLVSEYLCLNVFVSCLVLSGSHYYEEDMIFGQLSCFIAAILRLFGHFRHLEVFNSNTDGI